MSPPSQALVLTQVQRLARLTERERLAYDVYVEVRRPALAVSTAGQFFQLFLNGCSCEEIVRLNPGFPLGAVVQARIDCNWDQLHDEHRSSMMDRVRERVQQVSLETIERLANEMSASNKLTNDRVLKYLQTGDVQELAGTSIGGIQHLQRTLEMLMKLTGQDTKGAPALPSPAQTPDLPVPEAGKPLPPASAAASLDIILKSRQSS